MNDLTEALRASRRVATRPATPPQPPAPDDLEATTGQGLSALFTTDPTVTHAEATAAGQGPASPPPGVEAERATTTRTTRMKVVATATATPAPGPRSLSVRLDRDQHELLRAHVAKHRLYLDQALRDALASHGTAAVVALAGQPDVTRYRKGLRPATTVFQLRPETLADLDGFMGQLPGVHVSRFVECLLDLALRPSQPAG